MEPPSDPTIITLHLGNIDEGLTEDHIRAAVYPYGMCVGVHILRSSRCAFVDYIDRYAAEQAARLMHNNLTIEGRVISVNWAKPRSSSSGGGGGASSVSFVPAGYPNMMMHPPMMMMPMMPPPGMQYAPQYAYSLPGMTMPVVPSGAVYASAPPLPQQLYSAGVAEGVVGQVRARDDKSEEAEDSNKRQHRES